MRFKYSLKYVFCFIIVVIGFFLSPNYLTAATAISSCTIGPCTIDENVEVYLSSTPSNLLAAYSVYSPLGAQLHIRGTGNGLDIEFDTVYNQGWVISNVVTRSIPSGTSPPSISGIRETYSAYPIDYLTVSSGNTKEYETVWHIIGMVSDDISPVIAARFETIPWTGKKDGYFIKGRSIPASIDPNSLPYNTGVVGIPLMMSSLIRAYGNQSNGAVQMNYQVAEAFYEVPQDMKNKACIQNFTTITKGFLSSIGVDNTNYSSKLKWFVTTIYDEFKGQFSECNIFNGANPAFECPQCGPGGAVTDYKTISSDTSSGTFLLMHELGHGLRMAHTWVNYYCGSSATPNSVTEREIFGTCQGAAQAGLETMGISHPTLYFHPINRASVGWLKASQSKMVTKSGIYTVHSDNDDLTSNPSLPLVLQILVHRNGITDFVYVTLYNQQMIDRTVGLEENNKVLLKNGITLSAGYSDYQTSRYGKSLAALSLRYYSHNNSINDLVLGLYGGDTIQPGKMVHLKWEGTDITIKHLSRTGNQSQIEVVYNNLPSPSPTGTSCALKPKGDADCNGLIENVDFEIWRKEKFKELLSIMADFDGNSVIENIDFEIWRKGRFGEI